MDGALYRKSAHGREPSARLKLPLYTDGGTIVLSQAKRLNSRWKPFLLGSITTCLLFFFHSNYTQHYNTFYDVLNWRKGRRNPAYLIEAKHGAVAAENKRCSDIGVSIMKDGGNAVDAAVGAAFCTGVVNMFS
jgi:gamma-glutamyltranspeptidase/glutathione hydrolase/leukotriene-C4 hydrolase